VTIGVGKATRDDSVEINWPDASIQKLEQPRLDALTVVRQAR